MKDGPGSAKSKVLSDTTVTLSRYHYDIVSHTIIKKMIKALVNTGDKPTRILEQHSLWVELAVLSQFLLTLSFNGYLNG